MSSSKIGRSVDRSSGGLGSIGRLLSDGRRRTNDECQRRQPSSLVLRPSSVGGGAPGEPSLPCRQHTPRVETRRLAPQPKRIRSDTIGWLTVNPPASRLATLAWYLAAIL